MFLDSELVPAGGVLRALRNAADVRRMMAPGALNGVRCFVPAMADSGVSGSGWCRTFRSP